MPKPSSPVSDEPGRGGLIDRLRATLTSLHLIGLAKLIDRTIRRIFFVVVKCLRSLARVPLVGPALDPLLVRIDKHDRLHFELAELLRVCVALSDENLPYWVAGGWGVDALVGSQTRRHHDLDLVTYPYSEYLPKVVAVLTRLGYVRKIPLGGTIWFPDAEVFEDDGGHNVQILNINWSVLASVEALLDTEGSPGSTSTDSSNTLKPVLLDQCTATGVLDGVAIPTLSLAAQQLFHLGYPRRAEEPHAEDLFRLISSEPDVWINPLGAKGVPLLKIESRQPSTLLLIPIFTFPPDLWRLCRLYHNDLLIPPHVTLAIPFQPLASVTTEVVEQLSEFFEQSRQFDFVLNRVRWFKTNVVYFEPSRADVFRSIIGGLQQMFPDFRPYDGAFDEVVPHVTLSEHGSLADRRIVARHAPQYTPISARASHVWLMSDLRGKDDWAIVKIFHLGPTPVAPPNIGRALEH